MCRILMITSIFFALTASGQENEEFSFFDREIIWWKDESEARETVVKRELKPSPNLDSKGDKKLATNQQQNTFDWTPYEDPKNDEFFRTGEHLPPKPLLEATRNPTPENIKRAARWMEKRKKLTETFSKKMAQHFRKKYSSLFSTNDGKEPYFYPVKPDPSRYQFRMYFDSTCPHCKKMFTTLSELQDEDFKVDAIQIDDRPFSSSKIAIRKASAEELERFAIKAVPLTLVADRGSKKIISLPGFMTKEKIYQLIKQKEGKL